MAEETLKPISAAKPPVVNPIASATAVHASTLKLKPVIRKPMIGGGAPAAGPHPGVRLPTAKPAAPVAMQPVEPTPAAAPAPAAPAVKPDSLDQLKNMTQKLKGVTQQIPAQAILHKTGIIADQGLTEAQKQASKSRTARISLSDAMGVAPVKNEAAPMKTIRIKRPVDLQSPAAPATPAAKPALAPAPEAEKPAAAAPAAAEASVTQRKTLKVTRPGASTRPSGKFGLKKPGSTPIEKPAEGAAPVPAAGDVPEVVDIPDLPAVAPVAEGEGTLPKNCIPAVGGVLGAIGLFVQIAACGVVGFVGYLLYQVYITPLWCGGCS